MIGCEVTASARTGVDLGRRWRLAIQNGASATSCVDYFHTSFFNANTVVQGQSNLRSVVSVVYTFHEGRER